MEKLKISSWQIFITLSFLSVTLLASCSGKINATSGDGASAPPPIIIPSEPQKETDKSAKNITTKSNRSSKSYVVRGKRYHILESAQGFKEEGKATWYGAYHQGRRTASGEKFDKNKLTAAHKTLPLGTKVKVTNLDNGKTVTVKINDRGPFSGSHIIDLAQAAAKIIGMEKAGVAKVKIEAI